MSVTGIIKNYILNNTSMLSHALNTLTGGCRFYTLSARTYYCSQILKLKNWHYIEKAIDFLFFWQEGHCKNEYIKESTQRWLPY